MSGSETDGQSTIIRTCVFALLVAACLGSATAARAQEGAEPAVSPLEEGLAEKTAAEEPAALVTEEPALPPPPEVSAPEPENPIPVAAPAPEILIPVVATEAAAPETAPAVTAVRLDSFERLQVPFAEQSADLGEAARLDLLALADYMTRDAALRVELTAYASSDEPIASFARRLSLSRALAVRAFLVDKGVAQTRIDLRPLGSETEYDPADFVDILRSPR